MVSCPFCLKVSCLPQSPGALHWLCAGPGAGSAPKVEVLQPDFRFWSSYAEVSSQPAMTHWIVVWLVALWLLPVVMACLMMCPSIGFSCDNSGWGYQILWIGGFISFRMLSVTLSSVTSSASSFLLSPLEHWVDMWPCQPFSLDTLHVQMSRVSWWTAGLCVPL